MLKLLLLTNAILVGVEVYYLRELVNKPDRANEPMYVEVPVYIPVARETQPEVEQEVPEEKVQQSDEKLIELITSSEGFYSEPYLCPAGKWTIGYGFTQAKYLQMKKMSKEKALHILRQEVIPHYRELVRKYVHVPLKEHQEDALVSFTFNLGEGCLIKLCDESRNRLNSGNYDCVPKVMKMYCKAKVNGKYTTLKGLEIRRTKESKLFQNQL
jgi:lysozyme